MGKRLTAEETAEISAAFTLFDKDGDGRLTWEESGAALRSLGQPDSLDLRQFLSLARKVKTVGEEEDSDDDEPMTEEDIQDQFRCWDRDGDGFLTKEEFAHPPFAAGEFSEEEVKAAFDKHDKDGDGKLNLQEFTALVLAS